ncbi:MAG TPA: anaerobic ribonucleoside-triphosphate reductase [Candidatus Fimivivens sp.]|nr:anaerobic ribonucleoside-triphosphate reductase [Candidatus Fimivivens sp.]
MQKHICHDCGKEIGKGGKFMPYEAGGKSFVKCEACHAADPVLRNFQEAEVYSRIVGYIRPIKQWNKAKRQEFQDRVTFASAMTCDC